MIIPVITQSLLYGVQQNVCLNAPQMSVLLGMQLDRMGKKSTLFIAAAATLVQKSLHVWSGN